MIIAKGREHELVNNINSTDSMEDIGRSNKIIGEGISDTFGRMRIEESWVG